MMRSEAKGVDLDIPSQAELGGRELGKDAFEFFKYVCLITGCFGG
jgi:hypothetical protein